MSMYDVDAADFEFPDEPAQPAQEPESRTYDEIIAGAEERAHEARAAAVNDELRAELGEGWLDEPGTAPDFEDPRVLAAAVQELAAQGYDVYAPAPDPLEELAGHVQAEVGPFDTEAVREAVDARLALGELGVGLDALPRAVELYRELAAADAAERARPKTAEEVRSVGEALAEYHRQLARDPEYVGAEAASPQVDGYLAELGVDSKGREAVVAKATELLPSMLARHGRGREAAEAALEAAAETLHERPAKTYADIVAKHAARAERLVQAEEAARTPSRDARGRFS